MKKDIKINNELNDSENEINKELNNDLEVEASNGKENGTEEDNNNISNTSEDMIAEYELKLKESGDRFLRLQADFENFRKRVIKEREEIYTYSLEEIMTQLLPVIDNFERALESFKAGSLDEKYIEGLEMVYNNFIETLNKNGLSEIEALNCIFDPNFHHAVMQEVFQKGYMLNSKVIRPCMVKVAVKI